MQFSKVSSAQGDLTVELLEYVMLRVSRYFLDDDYEMLAESQPVVDAGFPLSDFDPETQYNALKGAYLNRNTVAALNRPIRTFEYLGVVRHLAGNLICISVSYDQLRNYLSDGQHLNKSTFEMSVYHFYGCHEEKEWNTEMRGSGTGVCIKPKLQDRFRDAGLLDSNWEWHGWSETMAQSIAPISLDDRKLTPTVDEFFQRVY